MSDRRDETVEVIVALTPEAAVPGTAEREELESHTADLGVPLAPLHPLTSDPELAAYAVARVDAASADALIKHLLRCDGVAGAYAKPPGAPPERRAPDVRGPV